MSQAPVHAANAQSVMGNAIDASDMDVQAMEEEANGSVRLCKTLQVQISGSLRGFSSMGPDGASWMAVDGKQLSMFGSDDMAMVGGEMHSVGNALNEELSTASHSLKNVSIIKATLLQSWNNFSVPLGVTVSCLPHNEVCDTGDRYTFTTIPNQGVHTPHVLYEAGDVQNQAAEWRQKYAKFNSSNLETQDVLQVPNCPFVFVHERHPIVNLLRVNKHLLGVDIDATPKMDQQYYKITHSLMQTSCDTLRSKVLSRIKTHDLSQLCVQLHRIGGVDWLDVDQHDIMMSFQQNPSWSETQMASNLKTHEYNFTNRPSAFFARIALEYELQR